MNRFEAEIIFFPVKVFCFALEMFRPYGQCKKHFIMREKHVTSVVVHFRAYIGLFVVVLAWHADATEHSSQVQTRSLIVAGIGQTFVDVGFTSRARVPHNTITLKCPGCVHTGSSMFTW